jgi:hypothetical protein
MNKNKNNIWRTNKLHMAVAHQTEALLLFYRYQAQ